MRSYAARSGTLRWSDSCDAAGGTDAAVAIAVAGDRAVAAGYTTPFNGSADLLVRVYRIGNGRLLWSTEWNGGLTDLDRDVTTDGEGVYVVGQTDPGGFMDLLVAAFDADDGELRWVDRFDRTGGR